MKIKTKKVSSLIFLFVIALLVGIQSNAKTATAAQDITKATKIIVVLPENPILPEKTSADELSEYLEKIVGVKATISTENLIADTNDTFIISIGSNRYSSDYLKTLGTLDEEEWLVKTHNGTLILAGGGNRGTLYATYHFLEDVCGVRWWNPWEEYVPKTDKINIGTLDLKGKPTFNYRDIYVLYGHDMGRFAARSRFNREGDAWVAPMYGASFNYGPPYHVHTFYKILPPENYYEKHPEWFVGNGNDIPTKYNSQLAMSNPEMRKEFLRLLLNIVRESHSDAKNRGVPAPTVFSVSQEDTRVGFIGSEEDRKLVEANGGAEAAILLDFVNYLTREVVKEFPDVYIDTLAYFSGEKAPTNMVAHDNVIVRLCDTTSSKVHPVTHERNKKLHEDILAWKKVCKNLRVWSYGVTFKHTFMPTPTFRTYKTDFTFMTDNGVKGFFVEFPERVDTDFRDLKIWVMAKLLEDTSKSDEELIVEFTDGYYGPAGKHIREYLHLLDNEIDKTSSNIHIESSINNFTYLSPEIMVEANKIFEAAESVVENADYLRRVRHARASLDYAFLVKYQRDYQTKDPFVVNNFPDRQSVLSRFLKTKDEQIKLRFPEKEQAYEHQRMHDQIAAWDVPTPHKFASSIRPIAYKPTNFANVYNFSAVVTDKDAEYGVAVYQKPDVTVQPPATFRLPMEIGIYDTKRKENSLTLSFTKEQIQGPGYHWYNLGKITLTGDEYMYFFRSWTTQLDIMDAFDPKNPDAKVNVWVNLKFEGEESGITTPGADAGIYIGSVVLDRDDE